jgi:hypothetical protein
MALLKSINITKIDNTISETILDNGNVKEIAFCLGGVKNGPYVKYFVDYNVDELVEQKKKESTHYGLCEVGTYVNDLLHGEVKRYRRDGSLSMTVNFNHGIADGPTIYHNANNEGANMEVIYEMGRISMTYTFDKKGYVRSMQKHFIDGTTMRQVFNDEGRLISLTSFNTNGLDWTTTYGASGVAIKIDSKGQEIARYNWKEQLPGADY